MATRPAIFKWRQTEPVLILSAVRWYLRYSLSLRDVEELLKERGLEADHTTNKGRHCIPEHHECKAKFILHLQQVLNLNPQQISGVLLVEGPPFSLNDYDVDRILAEVRTSKPDAKVACVHEGAD
jgi:hypothetical protein